MKIARQSLLVYGLLAAVWALVVIWQVQEHVRVKESAKTGLRNRSKDIAKTVSAFLRGLRFRGTVLSERLEPVLNELVSGSTNELVKSGELISIALLNAAGEPVAASGRPIDFTEKDILQKGERWGRSTVTLINPVDLGATLTSEGVTNPTVVLPPLRQLTNVGGHDVGRAHREPREGNPPATNLLSSTPTNVSGRAFRDGENRPRRPPWLRNMGDKEYQSLMEKRALHGLVLAMSTESIRAAGTHDLWLRSIILALATVSAFGSGLAWRNLAKSSDLQIRLVRTSELNTHLREMNLAAAGLAHETRNPLNIIRGLAQMISRNDDSSVDVRKHSREIINEADRVTAQLNEFINYSRPREVRRTSVALGPAIGEVVRALNCDLEEKNIRLQVLEKQLAVSADEQMLRQALFNLLLNAIQAVDKNGEIQIVAQRRNSSEAALEVRDNGPGVPPARRTEIFKPYFTTHQNGTGLGLAVVQQIVLAHGWEIECLPNDPRGAIFRITHLKTSATL